jgi:hypothetical protein
MHLRNVPWVDGKGGGGMKKEKPSVQQNECGGGALYRKTGLYHLQITAGGEGRGKVLTIAKHISPLLSIPFILSLSLSQAFSHSHSFHLSP